VTTTKKRARELARAKEERRRARQAAAEARSKRRKGIVALAVAGSMVLAMIGFAVLPALLADDAQESAAEAADDVTASVQQVASCEAAGELQDVPQTYEAPGDGGLGGAAAATFTLATNCGDIVIEADAAAAPETVNAMAFLAGQGYFDSTICHRLTTDGIYVLQCGDPTPPRAQAPPASSCPMRTCPRGR